jgi:hypothetical protein
MKYNIWNNILIMFLGAMILILLLQLREAVITHRSKPVIEVEDSMSYQDSLTLITLERDSLLGVIIDKQILIEIMNTEINKLKGR